MIIRVLYSSDRLVDEWVVCARGGRVIALDIERRQRRRRVRLSGRGRVARSNAYVHTHARLVGRSLARTRTAAMAHKSRSSRWMTLLRRVCQTRNKSPPFSISIVLSPPPNTHTHSLTYDLLSSVGGNPRAHRLPPIPPSVWRV